MARSWKEVRAERGFTAEDEARIAQIREQMAAEQRATVAGVVHMTDRDAIRREVAAEVIERADREAADHFVASERARAYGKDEMAMRAEHAGNAWKAVATRLRLEYGIPEDG